MTNFSFISVKVDGRDKTMVLLIRSQSFDLTFMFFLR